MMIPVFDESALGALAFAALALWFGWRRFGRGLRGHGFGRGQTQIILAAGSAVIVLALLYYLFYR